MKLGDLLRRSPAGSPVETGPDGLPLPPDELRSLVALNIDTHSFLSTGGREARMIDDILGRHGFRMSDFGAVLDFGCGCGRVMRHWHDLDNVQLHGSDYNPVLVEWCRENLRFARFSRNTDRPPLVYHSGKFDFVSAFSVFTHLTEELQGMWIAELRRVLKPHGILLLTTHGESYVEHLNEEELREFREGRLVVQGWDAVGTNTCNAFHPPEYVRNHLTAEFDVLELQRGVGWYHDVWLLRKRQPDDAAA